MSTSSFINVSCHLVNLNFMLEILHVLLRHLLAYEWMHLYHYPLPLKKAYALWHIRDKYKRTQLQILCFQKDQYMKDSGNSLTETCLSGNY